MTDNIEIEALAEEPIAQSDIENINTLPSFLVQCISLTETCNNYADYNELNVRVVHLLDGRVFFGLLLLEKPDSFIFACCGKFEWDDNGKMLLRPFLGRPMIRVFKSTIATIGFELEEYAMYYHKYLLKFGVGLMPSYFTPEIISKLEALINKAQSKKFSSVNTPEEEVSETEAEGRSEESFNAIIPSESIH